jgi:amino acid permease
MPQTLHHVHHCHPQLFHERGVWSLHQYKVLVRPRGAFSNSFKSVCAIFATTAFTFAGTELVGFAASEIPNPCKMMPSAIKNTFWRITTTYILSLLFVGPNLPDNNGFLLFASGGTAAASPFVCILNLAHISGITAHQRDHLRTHKQPIYRHI